MTTPYRYLMAAGDDVTADLVDDLCVWHDRMVAHLRRHGAASRGDCGCIDPDYCPAAQAADLWSRARRQFGPSAASLTFLRVHAGGGQ
ncbi:MAG TPA: hypothetical protein VMF13_14605 [Luteitalea sp.]|nr:hypothetical protein [Luteitalea sp.]